jgi:hypothetical protein
MCERCLSDDRNAALHGRARLSNGLVRDFDTVDPDKFQPRCGEVLYITPLVGRAAFRKDLQKGVPDLRPR